MSLSTYALLLPLSLLTLSLWIVAPFYVGQYRKGPKPPTIAEQIGVVVAGVILMACWFAFVARPLLR